MKMMNFCEALLDGPSPLKWSDVKSVLKHMALLIVN